MLLTFLMNIFGITYENIYSNLEKYIYNEERLFKQIYEGRIIMKIRADKWYEAIGKRKSRRKYLNKNIGKETLNQINNFAEDLNLDSQGVRTKIIKGNSKDFFTGIIGSYGRIKGASHFAVFIGDTREQNIKERVGYTGECFILEATANGLGTCWVAGTFKPEVISEHINLKDYEEVMAITPLGYTREKHFLGEKILSLMVSSHKRKELDELCEGGFHKNWPQWIKTALKSARLAPSAVNRQPWFFKVQGHSITVMVSSSKKHSDVSKLIDCGIAMFHLEVGAKKEGIEGEWEYLESPDVAVFTRT